MAKIVEGQLTSIALCWQIERADGAGLALTSHDENLLLDNIVHEAAPGMVPAAIQHRLGLDPGGAEVAGSISSAVIAEADLLLGRWDGARVTLTAADWHDPELPPVRLMRGELGEIRIQRGEFKAEMRGAAARLEAPISPETSPECRAELGDKRCRVDLAGRLLIATVAAIDGRTLVMDRSVGPEFRWGRARVLSGANCGVQTAIVGVDGERVELRDAPWAEIVAGDRIELRHGCDKSFATCVDRFANAANFRGEPHLPGSDLLTRYPGA